MNYRHAYHAGSFADVFKHIMLILLLNSLLKKDKAFCYLDTHAGIGKYALTSSEALKTKEFQSGISKLMKASEKRPGCVTQYLKIISEFNEENDTLKIYPGSPCIARTLLRPQDRMILTELHPSDNRALKEVFKNDKQVAVHLLDGYLGLKAFLPPELQRGLAFIDPSFESSYEFDTIIKSLQITLKHWRQGTYAIWYPVKNRYLISEFHRKLKKLPANEIVVSELNLYPGDSPLGLNGSGMVIINPPWKLKERISTVLPWLLKTLDTPKQGNFYIESW